MPARWCSPSRAAAPTSRASSTGPTGNDERGAAGRARRRGAWSTADGMAEPAASASATGSSPRAWRSRRLEPVRAPDDVEHDLVGAGADAVEAQVAPRALDAVLLHVAGTAVDLDALVGHLDRDASREQLGHRDLAHGIVAVVEAPGGAVDELARGLDPRGHLG